MNRYEFIVCLLFIILYINCNIYEKLNKKNIDNIDNNIYLSDEIVDNINRYNNLKQQYNFNFSYKIKHTYIPKRRISPIRNIY